MTWQFVFSYTFVFLSLCCCHLLPHVTLGLMDNKRVGVLIKPCRKVALNDNKLLIKVSRSIQGYFLFYFIITSPLFEGEGDLQLLLYDKFYAW